MTQKKYNTDHTLASPGTSDRGSFLTAHKPEPIEIKMIQAPFLTKRTELKWSDTSGGGARFHVKNKYGSPGKINQDETDKRRLQPAPNNHMLQTLHPDPISALEFDKRPHF